MENYQKWKWGIVAMSLVRLVPTMVIFSIMFLMLHFIGGFFWNDIKPYAVTMRYRPDYHATKTLNQQLQNYDEKYCNATAQP